MNNLLKDIFLRRAVIAAIVVGLVASVGIYASKIFSVSDETITETSQEVESVATDSSTHKELVSIREGCGQYILGGSDPNYQKQEAYSTFLPLSEYTCGRFSHIRKLEVSEGRGILFVLPFAGGDCGSGGCTYSAFLQNEEGLVKRVKGFDRYHSGSSSNDLIREEDKEGLVFAKVLELDDNDGIVRAILYIGTATELCGTQHEWLVASDGNPELVGYYEDRSCDDVWEPKRVVNKQTLL